ncbi:RNA polymerase sigma factor SigJ [uncultured Modestobacter sp.]|uniref:RNA polymerase sigma factor SigJ n=1 Tax=uncultured Modestobacter sp. TaxID=380048 RepID=UPI002616B589|nr:RNA polymerase sigma factor SigJ [uncultured Modestobacter sp.]
MDQRQHLTAVAFRMLGTTADAEDAVQETYARWYRLTEAERAAIDRPAAWLTRVVSRVCLDVLGSARARRERYVGEWLPEPVPAGAVDDPAERAALGDSVGLALLVVLETLTPAERVVFVLHEVFAVPYGEIAEAVGRSRGACRQLATSARRRVDAARADAPAPARRDAVVRAFAAACAGGDLAALVALLDPDVVLRSDGGGVVSAARNPVRGAVQVARFLLGLVAKNPGVVLEEVTTGDGVGYAWRDDRGMRGVLVLRVAGDRPTDVWIVLNPEKLTRWS